MKQNLHKCLEKTLFCHINPWDSLTLPFLSSTKVHDAVDDAKDEMKCL